MTVSTALATSFKAEILNGMHNFALTVTPTATATSASASLTSVSSMSGVTVGMGVSGTNIATGSVVATTSTSSMTLSKNTTGSITGGTVTVAGDIFYIALIKTSPAGTYDGTITNYSGLTTDEVASGGGYTTGGQALTSNGAVLSSGTAIVDFADVSWTTASFSCTGALIYNASAKSAGVTGRAVSVHSIGDTTVSSGTLTLIFPVADSTHAIIRLS